MTAGSPYEAPVIGGPKHGQIFDSCTCEFRMMDPFPYGDTVHLKDPAKRASTSVHIMSSEYRLIDFDCNIGFLRLSGRCFIHEAIHPADVTQMAMSLLLAHSMMPPLNLAIKPVKGAQ